MAWAPANRSGLVGGLPSSPTFASIEQQAFVPTSDRVEQMVKGFVLCWRTAGQAGAGGGDSWSPFGTWKQMYQESFLSCLALAVSSAERWWLWCRSPTPPSTRQLPPAPASCPCINMCDCVESLDAHMSPRTRTGACGRVWRQPTRDPLAPRSPG